MRFYLRLLILTCFFIPFVYFAAGRLTDINASGEFITEDRQPNNAEITLRVLTQNCGQCHQSSLPTANSKALAIFDLDKKDWYKSVSDKHLEGISKRLSTKSGISDSDRTATQDFIACVRKGDC